MVVLNKFEKRGAEDSLRHVRKQWRRNHPERMQIADNDVPVFPTIASRFNDPGVNRLFQGICAELDEKSVGTAKWTVADPGVTVMTSRDPLIPGSRSRYLAEIAESGRGARARIEDRVAAARRAYAHYESLKALKDSALPAPLDRYPEAALSDSTADATRRELRSAYHAALHEMGADAIGELKAWPKRVKAVTQEKYS
jgi:methylmalonyl-CoA mutase